MLRAAPLAARRMGGRDSRERFGPEAAGFRAFPCRPRRRERKIVPFP